VIFKEIIKKVLKNEGGYVNNPKDSGGETYKGITKKYYPEWNGWEIVDSLTDKNEEHELLNDLVYDFYRENYYEPLNIEKVNSKNVQYQILDTSINMGRITTTKLLQTVVGVTADGIIGNNTLNAVNMLDEEKLLLRFKISKIARYAHLVNKYPKNKVFLSGWINRTLGA
jgi:lysozyme family protein